MEFFDAIDYLIENHFDVPEKWCSYLKEHFPDEDNHIIHLFYDLLDKNIIYELLDAYSLTSDFSKDKLVNNVYEKLYSNETSCTKDREILLSHMKSLLNKFEKFRIISNSNIQKDKDHPQKSETLQEFLTKVISYHGATIIQNPQKFKSALNSSNHNVEESQFENLIDFLEKYNGSMEFTDAQETLKFISILEFAFSENKLDVPDKLIKIRETISDIWVKENNEKKMIAFQKYKINTKHCRHRLALFEAIKNIDINTVKKLIADGADVNAWCYYKDEFDNRNPRYSGKHYSMLSFAIEKESVDIIKLLIEAGANVNARDGYGNTNLILAVEKGNYEIVKLLLENSTNINSKDAEGGYSALAKAATIANIDIMKILIGSGADVNTVDDYGQTVLMNALYSNSFDAVKLLIENGAEPRIKNWRDRETALDIAKKNENNESIVRLLEKRIDDLNSRGSFNEQKNKYKNVNYDVHTRETDIEKYGYYRFAEDFGINRFDLNEVSPIMCAASNNDINGVKEFLEAGANINEQFTYKAFSASTAILEGVMHKHIEVVKFLIENGADVNMRGAYVPIACAVKNNNFDMTKLLLEAGADPNTVNCNDQGFSALSVAVENNNSEIVKLLLEYGADVNLTTRSGNTALMVAGINNSASVLPFLIANEADLNAQYGTIGSTALIFAYEKKAYDVARILIDAGADIRIKNRAGVTAEPILRILNSPDNIFDAIATKNIKAVKEFIDKKNFDIDEKNEDGFTPLMQSVIENCIEVVELLIETGADINKRDNNGLTAFAYAVLFGYTGIEKIFIKKDINLETKFKDGNTVLMFAIRNQLLDSVELLIESGANVNASDNKGLTPLLVATEKDDVDIVKMLINAGADFRKKDKNGMDTMNYAALYNSYKIASLLVELNVPVNTKDNMEITALMQAAFNNSVDVAKILLESGANISEKNNIGLTALMLAAIGNSVDVTTILLETGANVNEKNKIYKTAFDLAVENNAIATARLLIDAGVEDIYGCLYEDSIRAATERNFPEMVNFLEKIHNEGKI